MRSGSLWTIASQMARTVIRVQHVVNKGNGERRPATIRNEADNNAPGKTDAHRKLHSHPSMQRPAGLEHINMCPVSSATVDPSTGALPLLPEAALLRETSWGKLDGSARVSVRDASADFVPGIAETWDRLEEQKDWNTSNMVDFDAILGQADPDVTKELIERKLGFAKVMEKIDSDATKDLRYKM